MSNPLQYAVALAVSLVPSAALAQSRPAPAQPAARPAAPAVQPIPRTNFIQTMDQEFRKIDADKDGHLTRLEIENFQRAVAVTQAQARNRAVFARLDADRNGQLSPAEFLRFAAPPAAVSAQPLIGRMDGNRDQKISMIEHRTATLANFDKLDVDKDGVVNAAEMRAGGIAAR